MKNPLIDEQYTGNDEQISDLKESVEELLEVVRAMAAFDGRNNNTHLKEMARTAMTRFQATTPNRS